jgi:L-alanine-DL-glutamate epimerase-like enolase superfamily enzyme
VRIVRTDVFALAAPFPTPLRFAEVPMTTNSAVVALLHEAGGAVGLGYAPTFGFGTTALRAFIADDLSPRLTGAPIEGSVTTIGDLLSDAWIAGRPAGLVRQAVAVIEMALVDLEGKLADLPMHRLWGQSTTEVRVYASGGWRHLPVDDLVRFARGWVDRGFMAIKIQVGLSPDDDVRRLRAVREAVGPDVEIMIDANQRMPSAAAAEWAATLTPLRPYWLEEPIAAAAHEDLAVLRAATIVAIAAGESETDPDELDNLLRREALDVIQPDIHRVGIAATRAVGVAATERGVTVAPHMAHEVSAHVMSGTHLNGWLEYFDWFEEWWDEPLIPHEGRVTPSTLAGHGLTLRQGWIEHHAI